jgi:hypothetical protein
MIAHAFFADVIWIVTTTFLRNKNCFLKLDIRRWNEIIQWGTQFLTRSFKTVILKIAWAATVHHICIAMKCENSWKASWPAMNRGADCTNDQI